MSELLEDAVAVHYEALGIHLGLSPYKVAVITMDHKAAHACLIRVINHWVNNHEVSWSAVASALDRIDCRHMADNIRVKYKVS